MLKKHQLPVWSQGNEPGTSAAPTESAFRGKLRRYELSVGEEEGDLMIVTMRHKDEIDVLIEERECKRDPVNFNCMWTLV